MRARERGYDKLSAFWYSVFLSTFYEVGPEALFEQPSIQDLIVTPITGALLGQYFMQVRSSLRERLTAGSELTRAETWAWYLTDPLNIITTGVQRLLGNDASLGFRPLLGVGSGAVRPFGGGPNGLHRHPALRRAVSPGSHAFDVVSRQRLHPPGFATTSYLRNAAGITTQATMGLSVTLTW